MGHDATTLFGINADSATANVSTRACAFKRLIMFGHGRGLLVTFVGHVLELFGYRLDGIL